MARQVKIEILGDPSKLRSAFREAERATTGFGKGIARAGVFAATGLAGIVVGAGALGVAAATMGVKTAAGLEQAEIAFTQLLGSGRKAQSFLGDLKKFAAATPFELPGLIDNARNLLGVGVEAKKVIPILTDLGDAAGALGLDQERFNRVQLAVTQSMAKGKVQAEELMQITEAGIPVWQLLSKALDMPVPKLQKLVSEGKLAAADVFPKLFDQMHKDYGGSMAKQSQTLTGLWSTFMDTINLGLADAIKPLEGELKTSLTGAISIASTAFKNISDFMTNTVIPALKTAKKWWKENKDEVGTLASTFLQTFVPAADTAKVKTDDLRTAGERLSHQLSGVAIFAANLVKWWIEQRIQTTKLMSATYSFVIALGHTANAIGLVTGAGRHAGDSLIAFGEDGKRVATQDLAKLERSAKTTQAAIDRMHGKDIAITGSLKLMFSPSFTQKDWAQVKLATRGATGGLVRGPGGPTDDLVPALLSAGEFVVNAKAVREVGVENMRRLNAMRFAAGGPVGTIDREARDINRLQAKGTGIRMDAGLTKMMAGFGAIGGTAPPRGVMQQFAMNLLMQHGWGNQWGAFNALEMAEAGWNPFARNPSSGAFGLPQALPPTKMPLAAQRGDWRSQLFWMMDYIAQRWGSPAVAWGGYHARGNWYGAGLAPTTFTRPTLIGVGERGPETVSVTRGRGGAATVVNNYYFTANGVVGSQIEVTRWMRESIRQAMRREGHNPGGI